MRDLYKKLASLFQIIHPTKPSGHLWISTSPAAPASPAATPKFSLPPNPTRKEIFNFKIERKEGTGKEENDPITYETKRNVRNSTTLVV